MSSIPRTRQRCTLLDCTCAEDHQQIIKTRITVADNGCWIWGRSLIGGYGGIHHQGALWRAHRLAYVAWKGAIPDGLVIDHLCCNKACVNPSHLEAVTDHANVLRAYGVFAPADTTPRCSRGHEMSAPDGGSRTCPTCQGFSFVGLLPDDPRHGTVTAYTNHGCRCPECQAAGAQLNREQRAKRLRRGLAPDDPRHGTYNGYTNWKCRCEPCRDAARHLREAKRTARTEAA